IAVIAEEGEDRPAPPPPAPASGAKPVARAETAPPTVAGLSEPVKHAGPANYKNNALCPISVRQGLGDAMAEEMRRDDRVFIIGEEVAEYEGAYKVTQGLLDEFGPRRVIDTPITEYGFAGVGTGAAMGGLRPI